MNTKIYFLMLFTFSSIPSFSMMKKEPTLAPKPIFLSPIELAILQHQNDFEELERANQNLDSELLKPLNYRIINRNHIEFLRNIVHAAFEQERRSRNFLNKINPSFTAPHDKLS